MLTRDDVIAGLKEIDFGKFIPEIEKILSANHKEKDGPVLKKTRLMKDQCSTTIVNIEDDTEKEIQQNIEEQEEKLDDTH